MQGPQQGGSPILKSAPHQQQGPQWHAQPPAHTSPGLMRLGRHSSTSFQGETKELSTSTIPAKPLEGPPARSAAATIPSNSWVGMFRTPEVVGCSLRYGRWNSAVEEPRLPSANSYKPPQKTWEVASAFPCCFTYSADRALRRSSARENVPRES